MDCVCGLVLDEFQVLTSQDFYLFIYLFGQKEYHKNKLYNISYIKKYLIDHY